MQEENKSNMWDTYAERTISSAQKEALRTGVVKAKKTLEARRKAALAEKTGPIKSDHRETLEEFLARGGVIQRVQPGTAYSNFYGINAQPCAMSLTQGYARRGGVAS